MNGFRQIDLGDRQVLPSKDRPQPVLEWIAIDKLMVDDTYQRPMISQAWAAVKKIADNFEWGRFTPLLLAPVPGGFFAIIDGQHRAHAAAMVGIERIPAMVVRLTPMEQASAFAWVNGETRKITATQLFKAALASAEQWAVESRMVVEASGCHLMAAIPSFSNRKPRQIYSIGLIRKYVEAKKGALVTRVLTALADPRSVDCEHLVSYSVGVIDPFLAVLSDEKRFDVIDLVAFCEANSVLIIWSKVQKLRGNVEYFGVSQKVLMYRSIKALLADFQRSRGGATAVAVVSADDLGTQMATFAHHENKRMRGTERGA